MLLIQCIDRCLAFIEIALLWVRNTDPPNHPPSCKELLLVQHNDGFKKIAPNTIQYIEASRSYCEVHLTNHSAMVVAVPLSEIVSQLSYDNFIRIHRSFSVNLLHIDSFIGNTLVIETGAALPIGREYQKWCSDALLLWVQKAVNIHLNCCWETKYAVWTINFQSCMGFRNFGIETSINLVDTLNN